MRAKKSYGQHFLHDENICRKIAEAILQLQDYDVLVEVGPGQGAITKYLIHTDRPFYVIESDRDMIAYLNLHLDELSPDQIIAEDFLKVNLEDRFPDQQIALVGNFPYNISSQIVVRTIQYRSRVRHMLGMFQKEMADRILADHGTKAYGSLSVQTAAYFEKYPVLKVSAGAFNPPPKVQSKVIGMQRKAEDPDIDDERIFRMVVRAAFGQRRKMLRNSLKSIPGAEILKEDEIFTKRPEQLSLQDFVIIANTITKHQS
ncbi:MAG: 16S rRNA (adenine(1518)-N(6)/adenine(1519)-N(6))-dimethyltransferase RsmA [Saprospiraceae bacterium]|nr:16S rRNA (adenine(1518)-N(6)/adenine(1519)-N(6))-dimethyltransferase RsmA [Saprospiraceae bacterium]